MKLKYVHEKYVHKVKMCGKIKQKYERKEKKAQHKISVKEYMYFKNRRYWAPNQKDLHRPPNARKCSVSFILKYQH